MSFGPPPKLRFAVVKQDIRKATDTHIGLEHEVFEFFQILAPVGTHHVAEFGVFGFMLIDIVNILIQLLRLQPVGMLSSTPAW